MQENSIETRFRALEKELAERAPQGGVALLAVSKTFGIEAVEAAWRAGARRFGENYVQEGVESAGFSGNATPTPKSNGTSSDRYSRTRRGPSRKPSTGCRRSTA